jgi:hypothetical protein
MEIVEKEVQDSSCQGSGGHPQTPNYPSLAREGVRGIGCYGFMRLFQHFAMGLIEIMKGEGR